MDDTLLRKGGRKTPGVSYRRDPLGPPFQLNLVQAQRWLQLSAALPKGLDSRRAQMLPIDFQHAPTPRKPPPKASKAVHAAYREALRQANISRVATQRLAALRQSMDQDPGGAMRSLQVVVDGGYTNKTVLRNLPDRSVLIGRIRSDAKLYHQPDPVSTTPVGRRRVYGERAPTPEQLRQDDCVPWQEISIDAAGRGHTLRIKTLSSLRWRVAGQSLTLRLVVIAPLSYRLTLKGKVLYNKPAYLICTDPELPVESIVQAYLWRWGIEVNFRDEKTLLGVGQAQVRHPQSIERAPQMMVAAYSLLLLAGELAFQNSDTGPAIPPPKWQASKPKNITTQDLIRELRAQLWGRALGQPHFSSFDKQPHHDKKPQKPRPNLAAAVIYATG